MILASSGNLHSPRGGAGGVAPPTEILESIFVLDAAGDDRIRGRTSDDPVSIGLDDEWLDRRLANNANLYDSRILVDRRCTKATDNEGVALAGDGW